ncbi:unnamed protein product [Triticum turgidum subsp. durum]|uniref:DUF8204 domain-containing protein n=1 Tax=Triticum turgidum subsp. durum TaxID=4567 RepID=A0A9R0WQG1_TRITD|nr:unnamed protein product [Triticum turgidum subsp. durum]
MGEASPESSGAAAGGPSMPGPPRKGKSCKGCLYYSSVLKSRGYNPICVGIPRSIPQVPGFVVEEPREEAAAQGHDLRQFKYACAGYSMFVDDRDAKSGENDAKALLPYCQGLELLVDSRMVERKSQAVEHASARNPKPKEGICCCCHPASGARTATTAGETGIHGEESYRSSPPLPYLHAMMVSSDFVREWLFVVVQVQEERRAGGLRGRQEPQQNGHLHQAKRRGHIFP